MIRHRPAGGHSFRHDPRMRQALARLVERDRNVSRSGPAGTSLYWLLCSRRPRLAALTGTLATPDLLVVACALADSGAKLTVSQRAYSAVHLELAGAGLDWILRSGECLPCLRQVRPYNCLILGEQGAPLAPWRERLAEDALLIGLCRDAGAASVLNKRILDAGLADEVAGLQDGCRRLLVTTVGAR